MFEFVGKLIISLLLLFMTIMGLEPQKGQSPFVALASFVGSTVFLAAAIYIWKLP
jgi:hypothetical protein